MIIYDYSHNSFHYVNRLTSSTMNRELEEKGKTINSYIHIYIMYIIHIY